MEKATRQQIKKQNQNLVLKLFFEELSISRAEIARITRLTRTTVSEIVAELIDAGLVQEIGIGSSIGGKSPILLSLVDDSRYLVSLDLAHNKFCGAIVNLRGQIRELIQSPIDDCSSQALQVVFSILDQLIETPYRPLIGIGIGIPGLVNTQNGTVVNSIKLDWKDFPLGSLLEERYKLPVYVVNDCQAIAIGEYTYGNDHGAITNMIVIRAGYGIGAGIIINERIFQGDGGSAGEIGHTVAVFENGLPCRCGNSGCLETVASTQAVIRRIRMLASVSDGGGVNGYSSAASLEELENRFQADDTLVLKMVIEAGHYLGMAIAGLVGALNIHKIILTGEMTHFGKPWLEAIQETIKKSALAQPAQETSIQIGRLGNHEVILGAAAALASNYSLLFSRD
jgi:N-acetylglucosamine repressor